MASLFDLLRETMPIAAAEWAMCSAGTKFDDLDLDTVKAFLRYLNPGESYTAKIPALDNTATPADQRLWSWEHRDDDPATISNVWCKVHHAGFASYKVLDRLEWGYENMETREFKKLIKITTNAGETIELPLTQDFVDSRFVVFGGYLPADHTKLWPLEGNLDKGLVIAFVYEIDLQNNVVAWRKQPPKSQQDADDRAAYDKAAHDITADKKDEADCVTVMHVEGSAMPGEEHGSPNAPTASFDTVCKDPWGGRIRAGDLMPASAAKASVSGAVPSTAPAAVGHMKVLVVLSFSTFRERSDFEPGGIAGMARLYPHIMVKADVPLMAIEASVRYDRPENTESIGDGLPDKPTSCCLAYDMPLQEVNALLISDTNESGQYHAGGAIPLFPFWSNFFAYYQTDAYQTLQKTVMKIVTNDRRGAREDDTGLVERDVFFSTIGLSTLTSRVTTLKKVSRQGEFDNVHLAPKLRLTKATHVLVDAQMSLIDRDALHLDDIVMAPVCAHDCFHTHWRWGIEGAQKWNLGWDETGPYRVAGAPMVPFNQEVYLWLRSSHQVTYHALIGRDDGSLDLLPPGEWQVVMGHGSAYAVEITGYILWNVAQLSFNELAPPPEFYVFQEDVAPIAPGAGTRVMWNGRKITVFESTSLFYWYCRYGMRLVDDKAEVVERSRTDPKKLWQARIL